MDKIIHKSIDTVKTDHVGVAFTANKNSALFEDKINEIVEYINNITTPVVEVSQSSIITAIEAMKTTRIIYFDMTEGETRVYSDNETIQRAGNTFTISHSRGTEKALFRFLGDNGYAAYTSIKTIGNQIVVEFMTTIETNITLLIL